jgi:hypothetical protein
MKSLTYEADHFKPRFTIIATEIAPTRDLVLCVASSVT